MAKLVIRRKLGRDNSFTSEIQSESGSEKSDDVGTAHPEKLCPRYNFPYLNSNLSSDEENLLPVDKFQCDGKTPSNIISPPKKQLKSRPGDVLAKKESRQIKANLFDKKNEVASQPLREQPVQNNLNISESSDDEQNSEVYDSDRSSWSGHSSSSNSESDVKESKNHRQTKKGLQRKQSTQSRQLSRGKRNVNKNVDKEHGEFEELSSEDEGNPKNLKKSEKRNPKESVFNNDKPKRQRCTWTQDETKTLVSLMKERNIMALMDNSELSQDQIFAGLESAYQELGYIKTSKQMLQRFKNLKKSFNAAKAALQKSGESSRAYLKFKYYEEMNELLSHRPVNTLKGFDSCDIKKIRESAKLLNQETNEEDKKTDETVPRIRAFQPKSRKEVLEEALDNSFQKLQENEDDRMKKWFEFKKKQDAENIVQLGSMMDKTNSSLLSGLKDIFQPLVSQLSVQSPTVPLQFANPNSYFQYPGMHNPTFMPPNLNPQ